MNLKSYGFVSAIIGGVAWIVRTAMVRPIPLQPAWAVSLLLLGPLVLVPMALRLVEPPEKGVLLARLWQAATIVQLPAALLLPYAFERPAGTVAAALTVPWVLGTSLIALYGLARLRAGGFGPVEELCVDAGLVYLAVGGGWTFLARLGARPLQFEEIIVLLTAIHFHYAGFLLPIFAGFAGQRIGGKLSRAAATLVIAGVPLVAAGITTTQLRFWPLLEVVAAWLLAIGGLLTAWLHLSLVRRGEGTPTTRRLWSVSAASLAFGMVLASLYGSRSLKLTALAWLDIPWMRALHGTADALGFGLAGAVAWNLARGGWSIRKGP